MFLKVTSSFILILALFLGSVKHIDASKSEPRGRNLDLGRLDREVPQLPVGSSFSDQSETQKPSRRRDSARDSNVNQPVESKPESKSRYDNEQDDFRIPFWNAAHMINSIENIEPALRDGANGIEVDISFDERGYPTETYHGFPCDCGRHCHFRENLVKFVQHLAKITLPPATTPLYLVIFDLKLKNLNTNQLEVGGRQLATILYEHLYATYEQQVRSLNRGSTLIRPPVRVIISINHVDDSALVRSFLSYLIERRLKFMGDNVGFDVGMNDDLKNVTSMWDQFRPITSNIWQGDGLTNCANIIRGVDRLKDAISIRNNQGHFRKIYYWTADVMYHIRSVLRLGLDAILTNQPQRVVQVLEEPEFRNKYRLATAYDDPFTQFSIQPSAWKMSIPTIGEAVETVDNIKKTSANFVKTLPDGIAAAIKKVHNAIVKKD